MTNILETRNLSKDYRSDWTFRPTRVLSDLDLQVQRGECVGLLGPNGAGKTTTFKLILGFLRPTTGEILFDGHPITPEARTDIGFLPERPYFYEYLTVDETLRLFASLYGIDRQTRSHRIDEIVARVGLTDKRGAALNALSKGLLQRVGIAQAILGQPRLLVLDEPMSGLDPIGRKQMRDLIGEIRDGGSSVIFSSHILSDAEALCDRVAILTSGKLRDVVDLADHKEADHYVLAIEGSTDELSRALIEIECTTNQADTKTVEINLFKRSDLDRVVDLIRSHGASLVKVEPKQTSLEELFLRHVEASRDNH